MIRIERLLRIDLPARQSAFPDSLTFDLLQTDLMLELAKRPALFRERLLAMSPEKLPRR